MEFNIKNLIIILVLFVTTNATAQSIPGWVDVTINVEGKAEKIVVVQPNLTPEMAKPIEDTISEWKFTPGDKNGQAVPRTTSLAILISLISTENDSKIVARKIAEGPRILTKADTNCLRRAKAKGILGKVSLKYTVNADGTVSNVSIKESTANTELESCIINVTNNTLFKADTLNGVPIKSNVERDIIFK